MHFPRSNIALSGFSLFQGTEGAGRGEVGEYRHKTEEVPADVLCGIPGDRKTNRLPWMELIDTARVPYQRE